MTLLGSYLNQNMNSGQPAIFPVATSAFFKSIQFSWQEAAGAFTGVAGRRLTFSFYSDAAATKLIGWYSCRPGVSSGRAYGQIPVIGPYMRVGVDAATTGTPQSVNLEFYGSYREVLKPRIYMSCAMASTLTLAMLDSCGTQVFTGIPGSGASLNYYPAFVNGMCDVNIWLSTNVATNQAQLDFLDLDTSLRLRSIVLPVASVQQSISDRFYLPPHAFELRLINGSSGAINATITLTTDGEAAA